MPVRDMKAELDRVLESTPKGRNDFEGFGTQRIYRVFAKTRMFDDLAIHPVLRGPRPGARPCQLSAPTGIQIGPGEPAQILHRDDSIYPLPEPHGDVVLNTMWAFDDFTEANGATRFVPGSHRWEVGPVPTEDDPVVLTEMPAGSVAFYTGSIWHGGGANRTDTPRLGVILEYVAAWLRPQENHVIGVPPRGRGDAAGAAAGAARLQHLPAVHGLRRRSPSPPLLAEDLTATRPHCRAGPLRGNPRTGRLRFEVAVAVIRSVRFDHPDSHRRRRGCCSSGRCRDRWPPSLPDRSTAH